MTENNKLFFEVKTEQNSIDVSVLHSELVVKEDPDKNCEDPVELSNIKVECKKENQTSLYHVKVEYQDKISQNEKQIFSHKKVQCPKKETFPHIKIECPDENALDPRIQVECQYDDTTNSQRNVESTDEDLIYPQIKLECQYDEEIHNIESDVDLQGHSSHFQDDYNRQMNWPEQWQGEHLLLTKTQICKFCNQSASFDDPLTGLPEKLCDNQLEFWCKSCERKLKAQGFGKPHTCNLCNARFVSLKKLQYHEQMFHGGEKPFRCLICYETFISKINLGRHKRVHTRNHNKIRKLQCFSCDKTFKKMFTLNQHEQLHINKIVKEYKKLLLRCNSQFLLKTAHCSDLSKWLSYPNYLGQSKTGLVYKCELCARNHHRYSAWKSHLIRHVRKLEMNIDGMKKQIDNLLLANQVFVKEEYSDD